MKNKTRFLLVNIALGGIILLVVTYLIVVGSLAFIGGINEPHYAVILLPVGTIMFLSGIAGGVFAAPAILKDYKNLFCSGLPKD